MNPRIALAVRSHEQESCPNRVVTLELDEELLNAFAVTEQLVETVWETQQDLQQLMYGCTQTVLLHDQELLEWISCMGKWGRAWHTHMVEQHYAIMPVQYAFNPRRFPEYPVSSKLLVTMPAMQPAGFHFQCSVIVNDNVYFTHPLPYSAYHAAMKVTMPHVKLERKYAESC